MKLALVLGILGLSATNASARLGNYTESISPSETCWELGEVVCGCKDEADKVGCAQNCVYQFSDLLGDCTSFYGSHLICEDSCGEDFTCINECLQSAEFWFSNTDVCPLLIHYNCGHCADFDFGCMLDCSDQYRDVMGACSTDLQRKLVCMGSCESDETPASCMRDCVASGGDKEEGGDDDVYSSYSSNETEYSSYTSEYTSDDYSTSDDDDYSSSEDYTSAYDDYEYEYDSDYYDGEYDSDEYYYYYYYDDEYTSEEYDSEYYYSSDNKYDSEYSSGDDDKYTSEYSYNSEYSSYDSDEYYYYYYYGSDYTTDEYDYDYDYYYGYYDDDDVVVTPNYRRLRGNDQ